MTVDELKVVRNTVETCFGKKVLSYQECVELQTDIHRKTETQLSINTLRRFFGLIKTTHSPSSHTLGVLANYCGYQSISELSHAAPHKQTIENTAFLDYLVCLFRETQHVNDQDKTFGQLVYLTIQFLIKNPQFIEGFQQAVAKTPNGQNFYFEPFVNIDKLDGYYGDGLRYYLSEKKTTEAQQFGNALLGLRYWLTANDELFRLHYEKMMAYQLSPAVHPFVCGRYFGIQVLHASLEKKNNVVILTKARQFYSQLQPSKDIFAQFPCFEFMFGAHLILAEQWQEAIYYIDAALKKFKKEATPPHYVKLLQTLWLLKARALAHLGKGKEAIAFFEKIDPTDFYFLGKRFNTILYILTGRKLKKVKPTEQFEHLIKETNFQRLRHN